MPRRRISTETRKKIVELRKAGRTWLEIQDETGVSPRTISSILREANVITSKKDGEREDENTEEDVVNLAIGLKREEYEKVAALKSYFETYTGTEMDTNTTIRNIIVAYFNIIKEKITGVRMHGK